MRHEPTFACPLTDRFGRTADYLHLSVTDRCDLRSSESDRAVEALISGAVTHKPAGHAFKVSNNRAEGIARHMSHSGG